MSVGVHLFVILEVGDLISAIYTVEHGYQGGAARLRRDRDAFCDVVNNLAYVGRICNVSKESGVGIARGRGAEIGYDGLEDMHQGREEGSDVLVVGFAILSVVRTDLNDL